MCLASVISETSAARETDMYEGGERETERKNITSEMVRACVRACLLACSLAYARYTLESVIDLFREEAGISGFREGSVEER